MISITDGTGDISSILYPPSAYEERMMDFLFELFFEIFGEGILELIGHCYIKLMQLIVPNKTVSEKAKRVIKNTATTIAVLLGIVLIVGLIFLVQDDPSIKVIGKYMTYIPLTIIVLQMVFGIIIKIVSHYKYRK